MIPVKPIDVAASTKPNRLPRRACYVRMNERSRMVERATRHYRRNAFLFLLLLFLSSLPRITFTFIFATISTLWHITFAIAIFSSCVHTQSSFTRDKTQTRTDSFFHFSQTIFLRFLHLHTRYNKIHIRECHSAALFHLYSLFFSRYLSFFLSACFTLAQFNRSSAYLVHPSLLHSSTPTSFLSPADSSRIYNYVQGGNWLSVHW